jgi:hypothetical protein
MGLSDRLREAAGRSRERTRNRLEGLKERKPEKAIGESIGQLKRSKDALKEKSAQLKEEHRQKRAASREQTRLHIEQARERARTPKTKRRRLIESIHVFLIGAVTTVLFVGEFWPASLFKSWNFNDSIYGRFPMFAATFLLVTLALWPIHRLMRRLFDKPGTDDSSEDSGTAD